MLYALVAVFITRHFSIVFVTVLSPLCYGTTYASPILNSSLLLMLMIGLERKLRVLKLSLFMLEFGGHGAIRILCVWVVKFGFYKA